MALNFYLLVRHRMPDHISILLSQIVFASCFLVWRLILGTYGTYHYLVYSGQFLPGAFPGGRAHTLSIALVLASALQWFWGVGIIKMGMRKMDKLKLKRLRDEEMTRKGKGTKAL